MKIYKARIVHCSIENMTNSGKNEILCSLCGFLTIEFPAACEHFSASGTEVEALWWNHLHQPRP